MREKMHKRRRIKGEKACFGVWNQIVVQVMEHGKVAKCCAMLVAMDAQESTLCSQHGYCKLLTILKGLLTNTCKQQGGTICTVCTCTIIMTAAP